MPNQGWLISRHPCVPESQGFCRHPCPMAHVQGSHVLQITGFLSSLYKHQASLAYHLILRQSSTASRISRSLGNLTSVTGRRKTVDSSGSLEKTDSPRGTAALKEPYWVFLYCVSLHTPSPFHGHIHGAIKIIRTSKGAYPPPQTQLTVSFFFFDSVLRVNQSRSLPCCNH